MPRKLSVKFVAVCDCGIVIENRLKRLGEGVQDIIARAIQHEGKCGHFVKFAGSIVSTQIEPKVRVYAKTKR